MSSPEEAQNQTGTRRMVNSLLIIIPVVILVWWLLTSMLQERFIFPRFIANRDVPSKVSDDIEVLMVGPQSSVECLLLLPRAGDMNSDLPAPLVVMCHGNAELADHWIDEARHQAARGYAVLIPEYRGYGRSGGDPGQEAIRTDVLQGIELATARPDIDGDRVGYMGRSIGTAVAADVALVREPNCLVFIVPPASISGFAWGFGLPPMLIRHPYRTDEALQRIDVPLLICSNSQDEVVPPSQSHHLHELASNSTLIEFEGRHNFLFEESERQRQKKAIDDFLDQHLR
ncbi:MAG: alpha/beta hydrolase [Phycisphaerales bacterium]|nr:alpha/beta hydrolase [Phycisphaerales bacterium]